MTTPKKRYPKIVHCARCGQERLFTRPEVVLCVDCRDTMTKKEMEQWQTARARSATTLDRKAA